MAISPVRDDIFLEIYLPIPNSPVRDEILIRMANTYTQLYIQFVFAVQNRISLIQPAWQDDLYKYITGIEKNHNKHKLITMI